MFCKEIEPYDHEKFSNFLSQLNDVDSVLVSGKYVCILS